MITIPTNFIPRAYQLNVLQAFDGIAGQPKTKKKRVMLIWHRRAGKDQLSFAILCKEACQNPGVYYYLFPNYEQGRKALWENVDAKTGRRMLCMLGDLDSKIVAHVNNQTMTINLVNGSVIRVVGTDNIDSIRGTNPTGCIFSEFAYQDPIAWEVIRPILRENNGWAIFNSTPNGQNHLYKLYMTIRKDPLWYVSVLPISDNPELPEDFAEQDRKEGMDENLIQQEYYVSFTAATKGAIYADQIEAAYLDGRISDYVHDESNWVDTFWDLGVNDATAIWFRQKVGNKLIFIDYYENNGKDLSFYTQVLRDKNYRYRTHYFPHDGGNKNIITTLRPSEVFAELCKQADVSDDVVVTPKFQKKQDGIQAVRKRFSRMFFDEDRCEKGLECLKMYHRRYDRKREAYVNEPVHDWTSHGADALMTEASAEEMETSLDPFYNQFVKYTTDFNPLDS